MIPVTHEDQTDWFEKVSADRSTTLFTIYELSSGRPIGTSGFQEINWLHSKATWGIAIGVKECWGKGYGTEVASLLLDYGFNRLNLHHIALSVHADNVAGIHAYRKAGYKEAGRLREAVRRDGHWIDVIMMDCLAGEFEALR
jgi:RimJ/RimL family protein N-acetyltransferase